MANDLNSTKRAVLTIVGRSISGHLTSPSALKAARFAADASFRAGDLDEAERVYHNIVSSSQDVASRLRLGNIAEQKKDYEKAFEIYRSISDENPNHAEAAYRAGQVARMIGITDSSLYYERAILSNPDDFRAYKGLLASLTPDAPNWRRIEILESGMNTAGRDIEWMRSLAGEYRKSDRHDSLLGVLDQIESETELTALEHYWRGRAYFLSNEHERAGESFDAATSLTPAARQLGPAWFAERDNEWSLAANLLLEFRPSAMSTETLSHALGQCRVALRDYPAAQKDFLRSVVRNPGHGDHAYRLGLQAERTGDLDKALASYSHALTTLDNREGHWWTYRRATVLRRLGRYKESAEGYFEYFGDSADDLTLSPAFSTADFPVPLLPTLSDAIDHALLELAVPNEDHLAILRNWSPLLVLGERTERIRFARKAFELNDYELAASLLHGAERYPEKDGTNPVSLLNTPGRRRDADYVTAMEELPLAKNVILWESNHGASIGCHPLALFRHIIKDPEFSDFIHVWAVNDESGVPADLKGHRNILFVRLHSREYLHVLATARYLVNNVTFAPYFVRRPDQEYLNTWHGTPLKTLGRSMRGDLLEYENIQRNFQQSTLIMAPNSLTEWALIEDHGLATTYRGRSIITGSPRLDTSINLSEERQLEIRSRLGLNPDDTKSLVLYAPTWRGGVNSRELDKDELLADLETMATVTDAHVIFRAHRLSEALLQGVDIPVTVVPKDIDTNELLSVVDVLVTDYSSILFDYIPQRKPIVLWTYDEDEYRANRGLYLEWSDVPGLRCSSRDQLSATLRKALTGQGAPTEDMVKHYCPVEDGHAAERLAKMFFCDVQPPSPSIVRDYAKEASTSGRRSILFHASMIPNGIASALLALLEALDPETYDISLLVEPKVLRRAEDRQRMFRRLPPHVTVLCRPGSLLRGLHDYDLQRTFAQEPSAVSSTYFHSEYVSLWAREARRISGDWAPDVFVEYDGYSESWMSLAIGYGCQGARTICYQHNQMLDEMNSKYPSLKRAFALYNNFDAVVAVSPALASENRSSLRANGYGPISNLTYARNLIDISEIQQKSSEKLPPIVAEWFNASTPTFLTIGRMSVEKNQLSLLEAVAELRSFGMELRLVILGSGTEEPRLKAAAVSLGIDDIVLFGGQVENPYPYIKACDCFVLPSTHEGQPVTLLEAMTLGRDVIASDIPGNSELLTIGYGMRCGLRSYDIADALRRYLSEPELARGDFDAAAYSKDSYLRTLGVLNDTTLG